MKVKTKSGFSCNVNERKVMDWRYIKAAAKAYRAKTDMEAIDHIMFMINFLLGDEQEERLTKHVEDKDGIASSDKLEAEFEEITSLIGEEMKKRSEEELKKSISS